MSNSRKITHRMALDAKSTLDCIVAQYHREPSICCMYANTIAKNVQYILDYGDVDITIPQFIIDHRHAWNDCAPQVSKDLRKRVEDYARRAI
jgi:hypothetical protein